MKRKGRTKRRIGRVLLALMLIFGVLVLVYHFNVKAFAPDLGSEKGYVAHVSKTGKKSYISDNGSWLIGNEYGMWDMYVKGAPYELGCNFGALTQSLSKEKEEAFIHEIQNRIPSAGYLSVLKYFVGWFNRDVDEYIAPEFRKEIYGTSAFMADEFDYVAPKYQRSISYHAAHDIGHALQNMQLIGCTSFAVKDSTSKSGRLLLGRNFDFYFGRDFAKDQIVAFYRPDSGYQFMSVTWAGFSGVVSGMNEKGLSVTLNAAKSAIPSKGKTPVSIIAREVLQYASNIEEAYAIVKRHPSFIAETFLVGSAADRRAALIEKSPSKTGIVYQEKVPLIATNHFQSDSLADDPLNLEYMAEGVSTYRRQRVAQLIDSLKPLDAAKVASILRNQKGMDGAAIGMGNEKAVNQLIAHHSVIFSPTDLMVWVSSPPFQLGTYRAYDLSQIFEASDPKAVPTDTSRFIPPDPFLYTSAYSDYTYFLDTRERIQTFLFSGKGQPLTAAEIAKFEASNPNSFLTYYYLGDYLMEVGAFAKAKETYTKGLECVIARESERQHLREGLELANTKMNTK